MKRRMSQNSDKLNQLSSRLQKFSDKLSKNQLFDLTFIYSIRENEIIESKARVSKYGSYVVTVIGVLWVANAILALFTGQMYIVILALFSFFHLIMAPLAYVAYEEGKRYYFMALCVANQLWIGFALIYFTTYLFLKDDKQFKGDSLHHLLFVIQLLTAICIQVFNGILVFELFKYLNEIISQFNESKT